MNSGSILMVSDSQLVQDWSIDSWFSLSCFLFHWSSSCSVRVALICLKSTQTLGALVWSCGPISVRSGSPQAGTWLQNPQSSCRLHKCWVQGTCNAQLRFPWRPAWPENCKGQCLSLSTSEVWPLPYCTNLQVSYESHSTGPKAWHCVKKPGRHRLSFPSKCQTNYSK